MTTKEIIRILIEEKNYDRVQTERLEAKIDALPEDIRAALENWILTGSTASPEYSGYTVDKILEKQPQTKIAGAYLTLDWIRRDPKNALRAMNMMFIQRR